MKRWGFAVLLLPAALVLIILGGGARIVRAHDPEDLLFLPKIDRFALAEAYRRGGACRSPAHLKMLCSLARISTATAIPTRSTSVSRSSRFRKKFIPASSSTSGCLLLWVQEQVRRRGCQARRCAWKKAITSRSRFTTRITFRTRSIFTARASRTTWMAFRT